MDVAEFFQLLFAKLEGALKGGEQQDLLDRTCGGKLSHQVCSKDCNHVSENHESFFSLSLDVKSKPSVQAALELLIGAGQFCWRILRRSVC